MEVESFHKIHFDVNSFTFPNTRNNYKQIFLKDDNDELTSPSSSLLPVLPSVVSVKDVKEQLVTKMNDYYQNMSTSFSERFTSKLFHSCYLLYMISL